MIAPAIRPDQIVSHYRYGRGRVVAIGEKHDVAAVSFDQDRPVARTVRLCDLRPEPAPPRLTLVVS